MIPYRVDPRGSARRRAIPPALVAIAVGTLMSGCGGGSAGSATPPLVVVPATPTPTPSPAPTATPTPTPAATPQGLACTVADTVRRATSLTITPQAGAVAVVAIGSSSTAGDLASSPAASYPSVMQALLSLRPDIAAYTVYNKGVSGDDLPGTQARLQADVLALHPQLVILQAGTNDAIKGPTDAALADFTTRLRSVVVQLKGSTAVMLMNSQHYPTEPALFVGYQDAMERIAVEQNIPMFDRYALMKRWIDSGKYSFADVLASDSFHPNDFTYRCMAQVVAELTLARTAPK